jgi:hypothetical protein
MANYFSNGKLPSIQLYELTEHERFHEQKIYECKIRFTYSFSIRTKIPPTGLFGRGEY